VRSADLPSAGVITGAAVCPAPPLLARELTGREPVVPELRQACAAAVARLVRSDPELIAVVGEADATATWPAGGRLELSGFAPALGRAGPGLPLPVGLTSPVGLPLSVGLPLPLGLGARLLDEAGYSGPRLLRSVGAAEPGPECLRLGAGLRGLAGRVGVLVMAGGSARRSLRAPGYLDPRAAAFDTRLEEAVRGGDLGALRALDEGLARDLLAARAGWQVLAGALPDPVSGAEILYRDDPFGVFYLVAWLRAAS
jgi:hypothetical protein